MAKSPNQNSLVSIIILNYNSGNYLANCLKSLSQSTNANFEIIVVDNASTDNSISLAKDLSAKKCRFISLPNNIGFSAGNNVGVKNISPDTTHVLFLNPDTIIEKDTLSKMVSFFDNQPSVDAATCKVILAKTGEIQPECHRDFPTPLIAFLHFSGISSNKYFMEYLDYSQTQKINSCVGAFLMLKRQVGNTINWWNEKYFMYGEDIDLCFKLKKQHFSLYYYPETQIIHYQGISSGLKKTKSSATRQTKIRSAQATTNAMRIFYQQNLFPQYSSFIRFTVMTGIKILEIIRVFKAKYL